MINNLTPWEYACWKGHTSVADLILRSGTIETSNVIGSATQVAAAFNQVKITDSLLMTLSGTYNNPRSQDGGTAFSYAADLGDNRMVQLLMGIEGIDPDLRSNLGCTPLSYAVRDGNVVEDYSRQPSADDSPSYHVIAGKCLKMWAPMSVGIEETVARYSLVVESLLRSGKVDLNSSDEDGAVCFRMLRNVAAQRLYGSFF